MKRITLSVLFSLLSFCAFAQEGLPEEGFEGSWAPGTGPNDWIVYNEFGPLYTWIQSDAGSGQQLPYEGDHAAYLREENVAPTAAVPKDWLITPVFTLPANAELQFYSRLTINGDQGGIYKIMISDDVTGPIDYSTFETLYTLTELQMNPTQRAYIQKVFPITGYTGQVRIALVMEGDDKDRWLVDNVKVVPACPVPTALGASNFGTTTADLTWTNPGATSWEIEIVTAAGAFTGTATHTYTGALPFHVTGLTEDTAYKYRVRNMCADNESAWAGPFNFNTAATGETCLAPIIIPPGLPYSTTNNTANFADTIEGVPGTGCGATGNYLAGNDVIYSFTPAFTGNVYASLSNTGGNAGMFIYSSCTTIGTSCIAGATASATAAGIVPSLAVTAGTTYYIVVSTNGTPQTTAYTLQLQQVFCAAPTTLTSNTVTANSANLTWTAGSTETSWQISVQPAGSGLPATGQTVTTNNNLNVTQTTAGAAFTQATAYEYYVRAACPGGTYSIWSGPHVFTTTQIPATLNYTQDFETALHGWTLSNGNQVNKWVVGNAVNNGGANSLYISNTNGTTNNYAHTTSRVHAYRDILVPAGTNEISLSFDWRSVGENNWDFVKVWVVPTTFIPTPGTAITASADRVQVGGNFQAAANWVTYAGVINAAAYAGQTRRVIFEWVNDGGGGSQPPAAIDNINIRVVTCYMPTGLAIGTLTANSVTYNWTAPTLAAPAAGYDYYFTSGTTVPTATTTPTGTVTATTVTITPLAPSTSYNFWVRSNCGTNDTSFWVGPVNFTTPQIPATMNYVQNFDTPGNTGWTLNNGTQTNKWVIGNAVSNSPSTSLYVSNDTGTTNAYAHTTSTVHAYRDIQMPATVEQLLLQFDWKSVGENNWDFFKVWIVPVTFTPTAGTQIATAADRIQIGGNFQNSAAWTQYSTVINAPAAWGGTARRLVFEWINDGGGGSNPPAAIDNINFSVITCPQPSNLALGTLTVNTATFNWTPPATVPAGYDYYYSTSATAPTAGTTPSGYVTSPTVTINDLPTSTNFNIWVRSNCGGGDTSFWIGPVNFNTPQVPATTDYVQNFDGAGSSGWTLNNGTQANKWVVGTAVSNSPASSLYISNNDGTANAYAHTTSTVQAYRDIQMPATLEQLVLQFDWKSVGEEGFDYFRVWIVPVTFTPTPGTQIAAAADRMQIGGNFQNNGTWTTQTSLIQAPAAWAGTIRRLVFEWRNDGGGGSNPPAAIDNISLSVETCPSPTNLQMIAQGTNSATFTWTPPTTVTPTYDYYYASSAALPTDATVPSGNASAATVTLAGLPDSANFNFWVRSNCGSGNTSAWIGPINFNTQQVATDLDYSQNFDSPGVHGWYLSNGTQANKWMVGTAVSNSPSQSLYITNNGGLTNTYTTGSATTVHAYRDLNIPTGTTVELDLSFDWRNDGENNWDYVRVWLVPTSFIPAPGAQIAAAPGRIQVGGNFQDNANWSTANYVVNVTSFAGSTARLVFEWRNDGGGGTNPPGAIDNIDIQILTCPKPTALAASNIGMDEATFAWTEAGTATAWEVYVVPAGDPAPTAETAGTPAPSNPFTYTGAPLQPATSYQYYVRSVCAPGDVSRWSGPFAFNTASCDLEDQCTYNFVLTDSGNNGWQGNYMQVIQNDIVVATLGPTFTSGGGPVTVPVGLCTGLPYEVFWVNTTGVSGVSNPGQIGLSIVNTFNSQTVFTKPAGSGSSEQGTTIYTGIAYCADITCPQPTELLSESVVNVPNSTQLSWTPAGTETEWELIIQPQGTGYPGLGTAPSGTVTVNDDPQYVANILPGVYYEYYVRAVCGDDSTSFWSGPLYFSIFTPPACADVLVFDPEEEIIAPETEYVLCPGEELCVDFSANYYSAAAQTTSYAVESIPFVVPFPTIGGTRMDITEDDRYSPRVDLPFEFCFFGEVYNSAQVGSNGFVTFNANQPASGGSGYSFSQQIPSATFPWRNAIYGVLQDTDPSVLQPWTNPEINYQVIGNYPCRALVVNFNSLGQFGCDDDEVVGAQTSQIVIYEISNIVEVYVTRRVPCTSWNGGNGVIGIQNAEGTVAFTPPGRNTGPWTAIEEAWRFTPNGASTATFEWLKNGEFFSNDTDIQVCATEPLTTMTARATYASCNGGEIVRESDFIIRVEEVIIAGEPKDLALCSTGGDVTFDLNDSLEDIMPDTTGYNFTFYATEDAANAGGTDNLATDYVASASTTLWVRIMRDNYPCYIVKPFDITVHPTPLVDDPADVTACDSYTLPALTNGNYYTGPGGTGTELNATDVISATQTLYVYAQSGTTPNCTAETSFTITIAPTPVVQPVDDVTVCDSYTLPALAVGNYFTGTGGTGTQLNANDVISTTQTIYVYAETGTTPNCSDEESFTVTVTPTPVVEDLDDVAVCDSYVLPALTSGNYYTQSGGTGTQLAANTEITTSQTIYIYGSNGNCSAETSFEVNITHSPVVAVIQGCEDDEYILEVTFDEDENGNNQDNVTFAWENEAGTSLGSDATLVVNAPGTYFVTVTPSGASDCPIVIDVPVESTTCEIPRGISPNNDDRNDNFDLSSLDVKHLSIFNRYGQEVYSRSNYSNEWHGQTKDGDELPTGTYFYMIERANGENLTGWVYINRQE